MSHSTHNDHAEHSSSGHETNQSPVEGLISGLNKYGSKIVIICIIAGAILGVIQIIQAESARDRFAILKHGQSNQHLDLRVGQVVEIKTQEEPFVLSWEESQSLEFKPNGTVETVDRFGKVRLLTNQKKNYGFSAPLNENDYALIVKSGQPSFKVKRVEDRTFFNQIEKAQ